MQNIAKIILLSLMIITLAYDMHGQVNVINHKGSKTVIDTSKWRVNGSSIFLKDTTLNLGIGMTFPQAKFHTSGSLRFSNLSTNTNNTNLLTTNTNGDVSLRTLTSLLNGNAIISLNGLTTSTQNFGSGTTGTDFNIVSSGATHTFHFPNSSSTNRGLLTSSDWATFNNKENAITAGTTTQYWRGDKTWQTLNTAAVAESTRLYFTTARSRSAISLTTTGTGAATYNSSTGVFNIPTNIGINLASLSASAPLSYNNTTGVFSIGQASGTADGFLSSSDWSTFNSKENAINAGTTSQYWRGDKTWQSLNTDAVAESANLYFTNARSRSAISLTTTGTGAATYNSSTGVFNIPTNIGINLASLSASAPLSYNNTTGVFSIGQATSSTNGFLSSSDWSTFNSKENAINAGTTSQYWRGDKTWQTLSTDVVAESANLYFTNARSRSAISLTTTGSGAATYNTTTGILNIPQSPSIGLSSFSATAPLNYNNTSGVFGIGQATTSTNGFLSSTDWNTFNNKLAGISANAPLTATNNSGNVTLAINRNSIVTGTSSNTATAPLTISSGGTNAIVSGSDASLTINNTAPIWNANQLQGRNVSNTAPTDKEVLTWDAVTSTWRPSQFYTVTNVPGTTYTLSANDHGKILDFTSNTAITLTVPGTLPVGFQVSISQAGNGQITFVGSGGMVINNRWAGTATSGRWAKAGVEVRATNSSILSGDVQ